MPKVIKPYRRGVADSGRLGLCPVEPNKNLIWRTRTEYSEATEAKKFDRRRDRTCNLLIRSQAPCHWASRPSYEEFGRNVSSEQKLILGMDS